MVITLSAAVRNNLKHMPFLGQTICCCVCNKWNSKVASGLSLETTLDLIFDKTQERVGGLKVMKYLEQTDLYLATRAILLSIADCISLAKVKLRPAYTKTSFDVCFWNRGVYKHWTGLDY